MTIYTVYILYQNPAKEPNKHMFFLPFFSPNQKKNSWPPCAQSIQAPLAATTAKPGTTQRATAEPQPEPQPQPASIGGATGNGLDGGKPGDRGNGFQRISYFMLFSVALFWNDNEICKYSYRHNLDNPDCLSHVFNRVETINKTMGKTND